MQGLSSRAHAFSVEALVGKPYKRMKVSEMQESSSAADTGIFHGETNTRWFYAQSENGEKEKIKLKIFRIVDREAHVELKYHFKGKKNQYSIHSTIILLKSFFINIEGGNNSSEYFYRPGWTHRQSDDCRRVITVEACRKARSAAGRERDRGVRERGPGGAAGLRAVEEILWNWNRNDHH